MLSGKRELEYTGTGELLVIILKCLYHEAVNRYREVVAYCGGIVLLRAKTQV